MNGSRRRHRRPGGHRKVLGIKGIGASIGGALPGYRSDVPDRDAGGAARRSRPDRCRRRRGRSRRRCSCRWTTTPTGIAVTLPERMFRPRSAATRSPGRSRRCRRFPPCAPGLSTCSAALAKGPGSVVVEGRDIGTVVLPDAPVKIFLTASAETRAAASQRSECRGGSGRRLRGRAGRCAPPRSSGFHASGVAAAGGAGCGGRRHQRHDRGRR